MLLDFETFTVREMIENIEDKETLMEHIKQGFELIEK
jgi:hypothetical protein